MEKKYCSLINFKDSKLEPWRNSIKGYAEKYGHIYLVSDTETTGVSVIDKTSKLFHRVLEWSTIFMYKDESGLLRPCLDDSGDLICIDEPINPFYVSPKRTAKAKRSIAEIPVASIKIHGINEGYLFGENHSIPLNMDGSQDDSEEPSGVRPKTGKIAGTFGMVLDTMTEILNSSPFMKNGCEATLVFHNAPFDTSFLNSECQMEGRSLIESYFSIIDTKKEAESLIPAPEIGNYSLDSGFELMKKLFPEEIQDIERPVHTALIDANILALFYNGLVLYKKSHS
jgi:DNA polymerase III epsilon subunit-like protein